MRCERGVVGRSAQLLIRGSAQCTSLRTDEDEDQESEKEDERETVKSAKRRVEENQNAQPHETWMARCALHLGPMSCATLVNMRANTRKCDV